MILIRWDFGMRRKKMKNYPKVLKAKFLLVFTILRRDTLLKNKSFSRRKAKRQKVKKSKKATNPKGSKRIWVPKVKIRGDEVVSRQWLFQTCDWEQVLVQKPQT